LLAQTVQLVPLVLQGQLVSQAQLVLPALLAQLVSVQLVQLVPLVSGLRGLQASRVSLALLVQPAARL
jgi:hypothetical protein